MPSIPFPSIDVLGPLLRAFFGDSGLVALQQTTADAFGYMLPDPAVLTGQWAWLFGFTAALGAAIGMIFFGIAVISAGTFGDGRKLGQSIVGIVAVAVSAPATMALYVMLRQPILDTAALIRDNQAVTAWATAAEQAVGGDTIAIIMIFASSLALALAAGVLGFGMVLALLFAPIACAFAIFTGGRSITVKWLATTIVLMMSPIIAAIGIAVTAIVVGSAGFGPTGWVVTFSGIAMTAAAPFLILARVGDFGAQGAAQRGNAAPGQAAASAAQGAASMRMARTAAAKAPK